MTAKKSTKTGKKFRGEPEYIPLSEIEDEEVCKKAYSDILK